MAIWRKRRAPKKRSVYMIFLFSYIAILLLTLSSSFVYYLRIYDQITQQTEASKQLLLTNLRNSVESITGSATKMSIDLAFDSRIEQYAKGLPAVTAAEVMKELQTSKLPENIVYDCFLYIKRTDEIITPNIRMRSQKFFEIMYSFKELDYDTFRREYLDAEHFQHYLPIAQAFQYDENPVQILPFIQSFPVGTGQEPVGQVICFINAGKIASMAEQLHQSTGSDVYILDKNDKLILSSRDAPEIDISLVPAISGSRVTDGAIVSKQLSDTLGWKFVILTPKSLFFAEHKGYLLSIVGIAAVYLVVGLILVHFLTEYSYRPIREISRLISHGSGGNLARNEFDAIKVTLLEQMRSDKELNEIIENQAPIVKKEMLGRLLNGTVGDYAGFSERLRRLGIRFGSDSFLAILVEVDTESPFFAADESAAEQNLPLARLIIQNVGSELLNGIADCWFVDFGTIYCAFLISFRQMPEGERPPGGVPSEKALNVSVRDAVSHLLDFAKQNFELNLFAGISTSHTEMQNIPVCYDEARKSADYHRLLGGTASGEAIPVEFTELEDLDCDYYFPSETEYRLVSELKSGGYDAAKQLIDNILNVNTRQKAIGTGAARRLLFEMASTLQKLIASTLLAQGKERLAEIDLERYWKSPNLQTARQDFFELIDRFAAQQAEIRAGGKTARLVDAIAEYIQGHIGDAALDLNGLSQEFEVTPQYISNVFKRYKEENVKDYISKLRLERAKELLRTTDLPVRDIAAQLGYAGEIGIIRLLKKYEGITPGDYRSKYRG